MKVVRKATADERRKFRVPLWIQGEEVPECCGRPMFFVGQIDDDVICTERPKDASMWWHDGASLYVFTCSRCLEPDLATSRSAETATLSSPPFFDSIDPERTIYLLCARAKAGTWKRRR